MRKDTFVKLQVSAFNGFIGAFDLAIAQCDKWKENGTQNGLSRQMARDGMEMV